MQLFVPQFLSRCGCYRKEAGDLDRNKRKTVKLSNLWLFPPIICDVFIKILVCQQKTGENRSSVKTVEDKRSRAYRGRESPKGYQGQKEVENKYTVVRKYSSQILLCFLLSPLCFAFHSPVKLFQNKQRYAGLCFA